MLSCAILVSIGQLAAGDRALGDRSDAGVLRTKVKPDDAGVWVDGKYAGHADRFSGPGENLYLSPGKHEIRFAIVYFKDYVTEVEIKPREKTVIRQDLQPSDEKPYTGEFGKVKIMTPNDQLNAAVLVDGRQICYADQINGLAQTLLIVPGRREIELHYAGYKPYKTTIEVEPNSKQAITPVLEPE